MTQASQSPNALVVDASVATKWQLNDERYAEQAATLLHSYRSGLVELLAPLHILYEVPAAILSATRGRQARLSPDEGRAAIDLASVADERSPG